MSTIPSKPPTSRPPAGRPSGAPPATAQATSRPATSTGATIGRLKPVFKSPRIVLNAVEGFGKTTMAAYGPNPLILMARGETGYETLLGAGLAPSVDAALIEDWGQLLATLDDLIALDPLPYGLIALDAMGGFERMCHELVCNRDFGGDWSDKGFMSFQKGYDRSVGDWLQMLARLDRLHNKGAVILLLGHVKVGTFKNPAGPDFDQYQCDVQPKYTWAATIRWADAVFFGNFFTKVEGGQIASGKEKAKKGKGVGDTQRIIHTERRDSHYAKNRYGMPAEIDIPDDPAAAWDALWARIEPKAATTAEGEQQS